MPADCWVNQLDYGQFCDDEVYRNISETSSNLENKVQLRTKIEGYYTLETETRCSGMRWKEGNKPVNVLYAIKTRVLL